MDMTKQDLLDVIYLELTQDQTVSAVKNIKKFGIAGFPAAYLQLLKRTHGGNAEKILKDYHHAIRALLARIG